MYAATRHGLWPRELDVWINAIRSDKGHKMCSHNMHTQERESTMQVAVTLIPATTKVEKKNKDTSDAATRTRRDILV
jgi:hypothetical protein